MSVVITALTKMYGAQKAVDGISFQAHPGQVVGFLGPNGAGKSTTMKIITCYLPPTNGQVQVCGYDVVNSPMDVRRNIGYLPEHNPLYLDMYVHEYLHFIGSLHKLNRKTLPNRVKEMIDLCGLGREQGKKIGSLSKGYRQRVGLAQSLIHDPQVLILDEPTTGLDPNQIVEIRQVIKETGRQKTVIFSTHIMQEVEAICDRVIIINLGKIVADSPVQELYQFQRSTQTIFLEFNHQIQTDKLAALPGVQNLREKGTGKYEIDTDGSIDIRPDIFRLAAENSWTLIGIKQEEKNLESIFQALTK
ncbi:gliding motility-associated ABC transporter ATP-binding subunit GldA [Rhodocytophaga rosea]|uniref:Gliding motility-associated ABC transporter ATP-binding subunit GldA n=1 Tax=Rhodocytophaga rosea TaxID=2704465 RepID=A0A6C0GN07_9BACT|nr:gliding motility-associated ABC transporter ATP-binding subunit GldA [Rhodocytophaga rosea]QHT69317.1 gliding motility-associated ABC transporter ATP-binding subunit GldA [Rhodocytophaga rosea]